MKFWKSKAMLLAVLGAILLVMAVAWLCFYHGGEQKEPDGTLVLQEFCRPETAEQKFAGQCRKKVASEFLYFKGVAA